MYSLKVWSGDELSQERTLGFYRDEGAIAYAGRLARAGKVEVWRDRRRVAVLDPEVAAEAEARPILQAS